MVEMKLFLLLLLILPVLRSVSLLCAECRTIQYFAVLVFSGARVYCE